MKKVDIKIDMEQHTVDVIVIGAGPSGLACAIKCANNSLKTIVLDANPPGGKLVSIKNVYNFPTKNSPPISGPLLASSFFEQASKSGVNFIFNNAIGISKLSTGIYDVFCDNNLHYYSKHIVICTGNINKKIGVEGEEKYVNNGVSYCVECDGNLTKGKNVVVVGDDPQCIKSTIHLSEIAKNVTLLYTGNVLNEPVIKKLLDSKPNVRCYFSCKVQSLHGDNFLLKEIFFLDGKNSNVTKINTDFVFVNLGYEPAIEILNNFPEIIKDGIVSVDESNETCEKGIFSCGDVSKKENYQVANAIEEGLNVANAIYKQIKP